MNKYDDYSPQIFYTEDMEDAVNRTPQQEPVADDTEKKKSRSSARVRKKTVSARSKTRQSSAAESISFVEKAKAFVSSRTASVVVGIILAGFAAYFLVAFVSYIGSCLSDQSIIDNHAVGSIPEVSNKAGEGGARLSEFFINKGFGFGAFVIVIWLVCVSLKLLIGKPRFRTLDFTLKCLIGFVTLSLIVGLLTIGTNTLINWGGYHGRYVNEWIIGFFGWWGAVILCLVMVALFFVICMRDVIKWILAKKRIFDEKRRAIMEQRAAEKAKARELAEQRRRETELDAVPSNEEAPESDLLAQGVMFEDSNPYPEAREEMGTFYSDDEADTEETAMDTHSAEYNLEYQPEVTETSLAQDGSVEASVISEAPEAERPQAEESTTIVEELGQGEDTMVVNVNQIAKAEVPLGPVPMKGSLYQLPPLNLLLPGKERVTIEEDELLANKEKIRQTLLEYKVPIVSIEAHVGPTVTLYEIRPDKGNRISYIKRLSDDVALSLEAIGVRIIAPIPGRGTIGIEVANKNPQMVSLRSILESKAYQETKAALPIAVGSTISNDVYIADLASIPHLLVAGATGQGKSVGLNVILMSLLYKKRPDELKLVIFDPKRVEFSLYDVIEKQYLAKLEDEKAIVTDMSKVVPTLNSLCVEMENRYDLLQEAEVRKIDEYNKLIKSGKFADDPKHKFLPYIVVVVDEFADLMMTAGKEAERPIARLAQKARAVGIHVIIATQRPAANVITGNIKNNFPGRIAFKVSQGYDSKTILDTFGAEKLIGKGDMLILNNSELVRVQCAYVDTKEVKTICEHIGEQPYPLGSPYLLPDPNEAEGNGSSGGSSATSGERDPLYEDVKAYVISSGTASTSNVQRKFGLGYNRAGRIMDQLEEDGIVGPAQGGKARTILV